MKIGLIARADNTGLGIQSKEFFDHIPCKALVIDSSQLGPPSFRDILKLHPEWYPGSQVFQMQHFHHGNWDIIPESIINAFIDGLDIIVAMETPYDYKIFELCRQRGVKIVLQYNYEFLDYPSNLPHPDLFLAPSPWCFDQAPNPKKMLPVPVNTRHFVPNFGLKQFIHIAGRTAIHDRNGTMSLMKCLKYVKENISLIIRSQERISFAPSMVPDNVQLIVDSENKKNYFENYTGGVLVMPRKYGGLCLPVNEAIAAFMPVIMTDVSPNNMWLPGEWLVPVENTGSFRSKKHVELYEAKPEELAAKIDQFCNVDFYQRAISKAWNLRQRISWETLLPEYLKTFNDLLK